MMIELKFADIGEGVLIHQKINGPDKNYLEKYIYFSHETIFLNLKKMNEFGLF